MAFIHLKNIKNLALILCFLLSSPSQSLLAQDKSFNNPLSARFQSDLLPSIDRELTPLERKRVKAKIVELDETAAQELAEDNPDEAFALWYEAINLSRFLDLTAEMEMIAKVSDQAWQERRSQDINFLQERLLVLENENSNEQGIKKDVLPLFLDAYESLHYLDRSILLNQQRLAYAKEENDSTIIKEALDSLGELYLSKFDYFQAEPIYKNLLAIAQEENDYLSESLYLQKLAEISQALVDPKNSVQYKEDLASNYLTSNKLFSYSRLKISIGNDYKALDQPDEASIAYREAFDTAFSLQQYALAGDALKQLGKLYEKYQQLDSALQIYQELVKLESSSYNFYGLMNTYDFIATIYTQQEDYNTALNYLQRARAIAYELKYKEDYFQQKIDQLQTLK